MNWYRWIIAVVIAFGVGFAIFRYFLWRHKNIELETLFDEIEPMLKDMKLTLKERNADDK